MTSVQFKKYIAVATCVLGLSVTEPAQATVFTSASAGFGGTNTGIFYGYNRTTFQNGNYVNVYDGCNGSPYAGCSGTGSGTDNANPNQTAANDQVYVGGALSNFYQTNVPESGSASAYADLGTGKLGVFSTGSYADLYGTGGQDGVFSNGYAGYTDGLHFAVANATPSTVTDITVSFTIDGGLESSTNIGYVGATLNFGSAAFSVTITSPGNNTPNATLTVNTDSGWLSSSYLGSTANQVQFTGVYEFTGASADLSLQNNINANCGGGATCDYSHTSAIALSLPTGVSLTSDSGVFLTEVPEPATIALLGAGVVGAVLRRRAKAA